jgi:hypothetical protein
MFAAMSYPLCCWKYKIQDAGRKFSAPGWPDKPLARLPAAYSKFCGNEYCGLRGKTHVAILSALSGRIGAPQRARREEETQLKGEYLLPGEYTVPRVPA